MASAPEPEAHLLAGAERIGRRLETTILVLLLTAMIVLAAGQIFLRNVLGTGLPWADEALRLLVLWTALFGAVAASREDRHVRIDLLSRFLAPRGRHLAGMACDLFTAAVAGTLAWYSAELVLDAWQYEDTLLGDLPAWSFQSILPLAFGLIAWRYSIWFLRRLRALLLATPVP